MTKTKERHAESPAANDPTEARRRPAKDPAGARGRTAGRPKIRKPLLSPFPLVSANRCGRRCSWGWGPPANHPEGGGAQPAGAEAHHRPAEDPARSLRRSHPGRPRRNQAAPVVAYIHGHLWPQPHAAVENACGGVGLRGGIGRERGRRLPRMK